jgi:NADH-quinone oxidoreductase subunit C
MAEQQTIDALKATYPMLAISEFRDQTRVAAPVEILYEVLKWLKEKRRFDLLVDVTCVDYLLYPDAKDRFGMVYLLANSETNERIIVRCFLNDPNPSVPSIVALWQAANWLEREVWDLFGIRFSGHPDLRRIVLPEEFTAHPLRKDYPLQGRGERHNFPVITRAEG